MSCEGNALYDTTKLKCVACPEGTPILSKDKLKCIACPEGTEYREEDKVCVSYTELCESNYVYNPENQECECPADKPFDDGEQCVACYLPKYWNHDTLQC